MARSPKAKRGKARRRTNLVGEVRALAQAHTAEAIKALLRVMRSRKSPATIVVSAATALLDRGYGKPTQPIGGDESMPPISLEDARQRNLALVSTVARRASGASAESDVAPGDGEAEPH